MRSHTRRYTGAIVVDGEEVREVKNLDWLRRHWKSVDRFEIFEVGRETGNRRISWPGGYMIAYLRDGRRYETSWESFVLLKEWLDRPIFRGVRIDYPDLIKDQIISSVVTPHGWCERAGYCVEHEARANIKACR